MPVTDLCAEEKCYFLLFLFFIFFVCLFDCFSYFYFVFLLCMRGVYFSSKFIDCSVYDPTEIIIKTTCSFLGMSHSLLAYRPYSCFSHIFLVKFNWISYRDKVLDGIDSKLKAIVKSGSGSTCNNSFFPLCGQNSRKKQNYNMGANKRKRKMAIKGNTFSFKSNKPFMY